MNDKTIFLGDNLRLARLMSGISLNVLGELVCTTRQYIQQLESDNKKPTEELTNALAYELNVDPKFFTLPIGNQVKEEECHFRKLKTTLVSARRECTARATLLNKLIDTIENYLDLPEIDFPQFEVASMFDVENAALECRKYWKLGHGPIASMIRVLENAGAIITTFGEVSEKVDALSIYRNRPLILLNASKSAPRIRMDLAHEGAHVILHHGIETGDQETESQADYFASSFLLPRQALLKEYGSSARSRIDWNSIRQIKIKWGISSRAIIFRLHQLEVITPSQYRTANIHLSKTGQTKTEWYDNDVPYESPELIKNSISLLGASYGSSFGGLLKELGIKSSFLAELTQTEDIVNLIIEENPSAKNVTNIHSFRQAKV